MISVKEPTETTRIVNFDDNGNILSISSTIDEDLKHTYFEIEDIKPFLEGAIKISDFKIVKVPDSVFTYEIKRTKVDIKQKSKENQLVKIEDTGDYSGINITYDGEVITFIPSEDLKAKSKVDSSQSVTVAGKTKHMFFITYKDRPDFLIKTVSIPFAKLLSDGVLVKFEYNKYDISIYTQKFLDTYSFRRIK